MSEQTHTITLEYGFTDANDKAHKTLTFGHRLTGDDLIDIDANTNSLSEQAVRYWTVAHTLTGFGELPRPQFRHALMSLDDFEFDEVEAAHDEYLSMSKNGAAAEFISESTVRLPFGIVRDGEAYNVVTFGNSTRGLDHVAAERLFGNGIRQTFYLIGRRILKIETQDGGKSIDGPLDVEAFDSMDADDIFTLRQADALWVASVRAKRTAGNESQPDQGGESVN